MSKDWHSGHFSCWQCDEALTGQRYVLRDDHPYCIKCYESVFANVCEECNKIIGIDSKVSGSKSGFEFGDKRKQSPVCNGPHYQSCGCYLTDATLVLNHLMTANSMAALVMLIVASCLSIGNVSSLAKLFLISGFVLQRQTLARSVLFM